MADFGSVADIDHRQQGSDFSVCVDGLVIGYVQVLWILPVDLENSEAGLGVVRANQVESGLCLIEGDPLQRLHRRSEDSRGTHRGDRGG